MSGHSPITHEIIYLCSSHSCKWMSFSFVVVSPFRRASGRKIAVADETWILQRRRSRLAAIVVDALCGVLQKSTRGSFQGLHSLRRTGAFFSATRFYSQFWQRRCSPRRRGPAHFPLNSPWRCTSSFLLSLLGHIQPISTWILFRVLGLRMISWKNKKISPKNPLSSLKTLSFVGSL